MQTSTWLRLAPVLLLAGQRPENATLLDAAIFRGRSFVCAETSDRILIGQSSGGRSAALLEPLMGKGVGVIHDDASLWILRPDGRQIRFRQDYLTPAFAPASRCEQVIDAAIARRTSTEPKSLRKR